MRPVADRFMAFVSPEPNSGCWLWSGAYFKKPNQDGYGMFWMGKTRRAAFAHRVSFELHKGPIPNGLVIDHVCRVKGCVNPEHLRAVTHRTNTRENNSSVCTVNAHKTHCKRGHEFTVENTKLVPGGRECVACRRMTRMRHYHKTGN